MFFTRENQVLKFVDIFGLEIGGHFLCVTFISDNNTFEICASILQSYGCMNQMFALFLVISHPTMHEQTYIFASGSFPRSSATTNLFPS
jgi:hypothetical protein